MTRTYNFKASRHGHSMNGLHGQHVSSNARQRPVVITLFKKWFGSSPTEYWHKDGFIAEAWDEKGNRIYVDQINHDDEALCQNLAALADNECGCAGHLGQ